MSYPKITHGDVFHAAQLVGCPLTMRSYGDGTRGACGLTAILMAMGHPRLYDHKKIAEVLDLSPNYIIEFMMGWSNPYIDLDEEGAKDGSHAFRNRSKAGSLSFMKGK